MILSGHDGHLFGWDREFKYAGRTNNPPGISLSVADDIRSSIIGACFLSGYDRSVKVIWSDGLTEVFATIGVDSGSTKITTSTTVSLHDRIVLCGPIVSDPSKVSAFCLRFPANSMTVCPLLEELPAFGCLAEGLWIRGLDRPRRANLFQPNTESLPYKYREFDEKLVGDGFGRMAHAVSLGGMVINDIMSGPGVSPFYGRLLSWPPRFADPVFIVNFACIEKFLGLVPLSLREAARWVPVLCPVSAEFRETTRQDTSEAVIFVSGQDQGLDDFLRFYGALTKKGVVSSGKVKLEDRKGGIPIFRYNRVYAFGV